MTFRQMRERFVYLCAVEGWDRVPVMPDVGAQVNAGLEQFAWDTEYYVASYSFNTVASQAEYTLPSPDWKQLTDVIWNSQYALLKSSEAALRQEDESWLIRPAATPTRYMMTNANTLRLYPAPSAGSVSVSIRGVRMPTALSADADTPGVPSKFHEAIVLAAVVDHVKQYVGTDADVNRLQMYEREYQELMGQCRLFIRHMRNRGVTRQVNESTPRYVQITGVL